MTTHADHRPAIVAALAEFQQSPIGEAARNLLAVLGYSSDRTVRIANPQAFLDFIHASAPNARFNEAKALVPDWTSAELLFQLTDEELSGHTSLFKEDDIDPGLLRSYLFFAIELSGGNYARGTLTGIVRQINRVFPMPVLVLIKTVVDNRPALSIAVINRRQSKHDATKDVLGKVTIIRDISLADPHRGHLDILDSLALPNLVQPTRLPITNFDSLHSAWEEIFNVELLNRRFYRDLANWYFWALPQVEFPSDTESDDEKRHATSLIRLLTRLIFCWFLKEKGLVPGDLFAEDKLKTILKDTSADASTFYHAILQNLFFATLNQRMGKDRDGRSYRAFALDEGFLKNRATYGVDTLYRYESLFANAATALDLFASVPFLNGGLFECLDRTEEATGRKLYLDGFSRNKQKQPTVPNRLFFGTEHEEDLSEAYGDKSHKRETVRGLLRILHSYKFTVVENTPIDQEIALDPELLGKVFENLLASYNEETKTTARKQTGSFYTPRAIVEYMVDESLRAHLTGALGRAGMTDADAQAGLDILFAYTEREHAFREPEVAALLEAIHMAKILDPACGSGAFPMGMLQKLVHIIHKLDPDNARWKQLQIDTAAQIPDPSSRDAAISAIERDFADNEDDYGRKLYLIENCLYGVDIQPIAIQISKLRFFISLLCDQRTNRSKKDNHGVRPLPNLETKFVAADTLVGLPEISQMVIAPGRVYQIETEIEALYHRHFAIQRRDQKLSLQRKIRGLRSELSMLLAESLMAPEKAALLASWDPFDPQASSDFFDPHWMFGRSLVDGFDIVLGNPPYQSAIEHKKTKGAAYRALLRRQYHSAKGAWDLYVPFFEGAMRLLRSDGILAYISPNKFLSASYGNGLREYLLNTCSIVSLTDVSHLPVFESASVYPVISVFRNGAPPQAYQLRLNLPVSKSSQFNLKEYYLTSQDSEALTMLPENLWGFLLSPSLGVLVQLLTDCDTLGEVARVRATTTAAEADAIGSTLSSAPRGRWKTLNTGTIDPFCNRWDSNPIRHQGNSIPRPMIPDGPIVSQNRRELYSEPKLIIAKMSLRFEGFVDQHGEYGALNCNCASEPKRGWTLDALAAVLHSSVVAFAYRQYFDGLRMAGGYLPFQAPQLRMIPVPRVTGAHVPTLDALGRLRAIATNPAVSESAKAFLADLTDTCVMECYFPEYMAAKDLSVMTELAPHLAAFHPDASSELQHEFVAQLHSTVNAPASPIRNRLLRIGADSPELLGVIKREGIV